MPRRVQNDLSASTNPIQYGLCLSGTVVDRTRRFVPRDNPVTEIVTYTLSDNENCKYYVDDYAPSEYHELGTTISVPVYVKPYTKRNKEISYNLCVQKKATLQGEHF